MRRAAEAVIDPSVPGFSEAFPGSAEIDEVYRSSYLDVHQRHIQAQPGMQALMA
jgi:hypothetical protein